MMKSTFFSALRARLPGLFLILLGIGGGYLYYQTQLCGGTCPLTAAPFWPMAAGGFWGALAYDLGSALHARLTSTSPEE